MLQHLPLLLVMPPRKSQRQRKFLLPHLQLLRHLPRERIAGVDWDRIELAPTTPGQTRSIVRLANPLGHTRAFWPDTDDDDGAPGESVE